MWEESWGVKTGGGVMGKSSAGLTQRVLLVGQTLGGGLWGKASSWLQRRVGPALWGRKEEAWSTFSKPAEVGVCKEGMGRGDGVGLRREWVEEGR